jgi:hypothetical protein
MRVQLFILGMLLCSCGRGASSDRSASLTARTPSPPVTQASDSFPSVDDSRLSVNRIRLGQTESEVRAILGTPISKSEPKHEEVLADPSWALAYPDLTVRFTGRRVAEVSCLAETCVTPDGIRIGNSREIVETTYGPGRYDPVGESLSYFARRSDCAITFVFYSGKVGTIKLWCNET